MDALKTALDHAGIAVSDSALDRLNRFTLLLHEWNRIHNLTGAKTIGAIHDHIVDSLYPATFVDRPDSLLDVGTGAGFPGLALSIMWPKTETVLTEPLGKRAAFLAYAAMELGLVHVTVARMRVEALVHPSFGLITSRAVTDTALLLELTRALRNTRTQYLFYKGSRVADEVAALTQQPNYAIVQWNKRSFLWIK